LHDLLATIENEALADLELLARSLNESLIKKHTQRSSKAISEFRRRDEQRVRSVEVIREDWPNLLQDVDGAVSVDPRLGEVVDRWVDTANRILGSLLPAPPELTCAVRPLW
ncbi:MAG: hypothetical protein ACO3PR_17455, partial [Limisphaerales bacterium]